MCPAIHVPHCGLRGVSFTISVYGSFCALLRFVFARAYG